MQRQILPPHGHPADSEAYLAACSPEERQLVALAIDQLGSSYFMEKSHGYLAWKKSAAATTPQVVVVPKAVDTFGSTAVATAVSTAVAAAEKKPETK